MKVLIADDEELVREGIELAVDWTKFGVKERLFAEDGHQAVELIRAHRPAVLFCDMSMPGMNGMELLKQIREEQIDIQIIIVSGYDDFTFARAAIQSGGVDYILKPFRKKDLEEPLEKAVAAWRQSELSQEDNRQKQHRLNQADAMLDEQKLAMYFKGEITYHEGMRGLFYKIGLPLHSIKAALLLAQNRVELIDRRFQGDEELFIFAVNNILHEILKPYGAHYICKLDEFQWLLLIHSKEGMGSHQEYQRYIAKILNGWNRTLGLRVLTGLADEEADVQSLPGAVKSAGMNLLQSSLLPGGSANPPKEMQQLRFMDKQVLLQAALKNRDKLYAADIIRSFVQKLKDLGGLSLKRLQTYTIEGNLMLEQASQMNGAAKESGIKFIPIWVSDLDEWKKRQTQQWWALMEEGGDEVSGSGSIQAVRDYIHRHFQEEISLSFLSERFHFSPQYIAKKFKELYNTTVMTYVIELRMEKASSLLAHTDLPVTEIANTLGYTDENYFGKVFRKRHGVSPLQYRKHK
jgi:two-component system response regulator YesN